MLEITCNIRHITAPTSHMLINNLCHFITPINHPDDLAHPLRQRQPFHFICTTSPTKRILPAHTDTNQTFIIGVIKLCRGPAPACVYVKLDRWQVHNGEHASVTDQFKSLSVEGNLFVTEEGQFDPVKRGFWLEAVDLDAKRVSHPSLVVSTIFCPLINCYPFSPPTAQQATSDCKEPWSNKGNVPC